MRAHVVLVTSAMSLCRSGSCNGSKMYDPATPRPRASSSKRTCWLSSGRDPSGPSSQSRYPASLISSKTSSHGGAPGMSGLSTPHETGPFARSMPIACPLLSTGRRLDTDALVFGFGFVHAACDHHLVALADLGHAHFPPASTAGPLVVGDVDTDDVAAPRGLCPGERSGKTLEPFDMLGPRAESLGVLGKIDALQLLVTSRVQQVVERLAALVDLQVVDGGEAAVVADDEDHLVSGEHRRIDVGVHHQVRAVANEGDHIRLWSRHLCAERAGDLVAHRGHPELRVEAADGLRSPTADEFTGQA